jgi:hypothetical protein
LRAGAKRRFPALNRLEELQELQAFATAADRAGLALPEDGQGYRNAPITWAKGDWPPIAVLSALARRPTSRDANASSRLVLVGVDGGIFCCQLRGWARSRSRCPFAVWALDVQHLVINARNHPYTHDPAMGTPRPTSAPICQTLRRLYYDLDNLSRLYYHLGMMINLSPSTTEIAARSAKNVDMSVEEFVEDIIVGNAVKKGELAKDSAAALAQDVLADVRQFVSSRPAHPHMTRLAFEALVANRNSRRRLEAASLDRKHAHALHLRVARLVKSLMGWESGRQVLVPKTTGLPIGSYTEFVPPSPGRRS